MAAFDPSGKTAIVTGGGSGESMQCYRALICIHDLF